MEREEAEREEERKRAEEDKVEEKPSGYARGQMFQRNVPVPAEPLGHPLPPPPLHQQVPEISAVGKKPNYIHVSLTPVFKFVKLFL